MPIKLRIKLNDNVEIEREVEGEKGVVTALSFFPTVPENCPICQAQTYYFMRTAKENHFYGKFCTNPTAPHETTFGQYRTGDRLFYKQKWQPKQFGVNDDTHEEAHEPATVATPTEPKPAVAAAAAGNTKPTPTATGQTNPPPPEPMKIKSFEDQLNERAEGMFTAGYVEKKNEFWFVSELSKTTGELTQYRVEKKKVKSANGFTELITCQCSDFVERKVDRCAHKRAILLFVNSQNAKPVTPNAEPSPELDTPKIFDGHARSMHPNDLLKSNQITKIRELAELLSLDADVESEAHLGCAVRHLRRDAADAFIKYLADLVEVLG